MKYDIYPKLCKALLKKPIYKELKKRKPDVFNKAYKSRVNKEYRDIIERTESIGGIKENPFEMTLMFAAFAIAVYKCGYSKIDEDDMEAMVDAVCNSKFMKISTKYQKAFSKKTIEGRIKAAEMTQKKKYKNDWLTTFEYEEGSGEYYITHSECGVCKICIQEDCFNIVKYLCKLDYPAFDNQGVILDRTKTLGYGDDCCNFHVMTKEKAKKINFVKSPDAK